MRTGVVETYARALLEAVWRFNDKRGFVMCSHVAMSMLLALFPFLLFVVALAGAMTADVQTEAFINMILGTWPDEIAEPIAKEVRTVMAGGSTRHLTFSALLALYFASNGVDALRAAMTRAYMGHDPRPWWRQRLLCVSFVLGGAFLMVVAAIVGIAAPLYLRFVQDAAPELYLWIFTNAYVRDAVTLGAMIVVVAGLHIWLPGTRRRQARVWPGILLTVVAWLLAGAGFSFYLERYASYSATYAGLAGAMSALIFLYFMAAILIIGAEFNAVLSHVDRDEVAD